jgi:UPF0716 protein FxsA
MGLMRKLLLVFILVPALELALLIEIGSRLGILPTFLVLGLIGLLGAFVARRQGLGAIRAAQEQVQRGELPGGPIVDGVLILIAALLLMAPGFLTDILGFGLLFKSVRNRLKAHLADWFRRGVEERRIRVYAAGLGRSPFVSDRFPTAVHEETPPYKIH